MSPRALLLEQIIHEARQHKAHGERLKAIFDLDSTLFDVSHRIAKILNDYGHEPRIQEKYPTQAAILKKVQPHAEDWGVKRTLVRYGVEIPDEIFVKDLVHYW